jgi:hypothetical protein
MVDIPADDVFTDRARAEAARAWRTLAVLALLGIVSFAAVSDQPSADRGQRRECGPFIIGQSLLGGCDWLE